MFHLHSLFPAHPLTADLHFEHWAPDHTSVSDHCAEGLPALLDLTNSAVVRELNTPEMRALLPTQHTVLVSAGSLPPALTKALAALDYESIHSLPSRFSGRYPSNR